MTASTPPQGAIDLVQMELQPPKDPDVNMLELHPRAQDTPSASASPAALDVDRHRLLPVQQYTWEDQGACIELQISTRHHIAGVWKVQGKGVPWGFIDHWHRYITLSAMLQAARMLGLAPQTFMFSSESALRRAALRHLTERCA